MGHLFYAMSCFVHYFKANREFKLELETSKFVLPHVNLKCHGWPWKTIGHLFDATSSFLCHFITTNQFKLELQCGNHQFGKNRQFFVLCYLEIWQMTLKNRRGHLLCYFKFCASFHSHLWIQTGITVRKRPILGSNRRLFVPPWNLTNDLEKQKGTSSMLL